VFPVACHPVVVAFRGSGVGRQYVVSYVLWSSLQNSIVANQRTLAPIFYSCLEVWRHILDLQIHLQAVG
jgi:hypothetical protein